MSKVSMEWLLSKSANKNRLRTDLRVKERNPLEILSNELLREDWLDVASDCQAFVDNQLPTKAQKIKDEMHSLLCEECDLARKVIVKNNRFFFHNEETGVDTPILIDEVEDVPYSTKPYLPDSLLPSKSKEGIQ